MDKRVTAAGAAGAAMMLCLFALILGVFPGISVADNPNPPGTPTADVCASSVHFYANDAPTGSNFFGPAADGNVGQLKEELHTRRCADPALVVAHAHTWGIPGFTELSGDEAFAAKTRAVASKPPVWRAIVAQMEALESGSIASVEMMSGPYETLYMLTGVTDVPSIRKAAPDRPEFAVIRFSRPDGYTVDLKIDCGFQPVAQEFPGIPPVSSPPPSGPPPTPSVPPPTTPHTVPPEVCPPDMPHGKPPVCKDSPDRDPARQGNVPPQVTGTAPPITGPATPPAAGNPPEVYVPPTVPVAPVAPGAEPPTPNTTVPRNEGAPPSNPVPADPPTGPVCDPRICG